MRSAPDLRCAAAARAFEGPCDIETVADAPAVDRYSAHSGSAVARVQVACPYPAHAGLAEPRRHQGLFQARPATLPPPRLSKSDAHPTTPWGRAMSDRRTSYTGAAAGYDDEFRKRLADAIFTAIAETSLVTDSGTRDALVDCLITVMSLTPLYDTP